MKIKSTRKRYTKKWVTMPSNFFELEKLLIEYWEQGVIDGVKLSTNILIKKVRQ